MSRSISVLQILPELDSGGVERGTLELAQALVNQGHRSLVMSGGGRLVSDLEQQGSEHLTWPIGRKSLLSFRFVRPLRRLLQEQQVDVLHIRSRMPGWIAWHAWKGLPQEQRPRLVTTVHGLYSVGRYSSVMTRGEQVIAVSETVRRYIEQNYATDPARITVIPRGIDPDEYPFGYQPSAEWLRQWRQQYPQLNDKLVLTLPGRITRLKGHEALISLVGQLKQQGKAVHALIVGGTAKRKQRYHQELQEKIHAAGLQQDITFTGHRSDLRDIMAVSSAVLSLSSKPEAFGRTAVEALSMGIPMIGWDHGGIGETLQTLYPQGLVKLNDASALLERCKQLAQHDTVQLPQRPFTLEQMQQQTIDLYLNKSLSR